MKTPRKLTALVLMGALTASSLAAVPASAKTFSDVPSNHWAYTVIDEISTQNIMVGVGDGLFSPNTALTRAEYAAILCNLAPDKSNGRFEANYDDVAADAWYAESADWAVTNGIIEAVDGKFNPSGLVTRELMADMTYNFIYYYFTSALVNNSTSAGYSDEAQISADYLNAVNILSNNGLLVGRGSNQFVPQGTLTRAETAAMAVRVIEFTGVTPGNPEQPGEPEQPETPSEPENPSEDPNTPVTPEDPSEEPETPAEDPSDSSNWELDGAPKWFLVGQPDNISDEVWNELITYYAGKERPANSNYPSSIESLPYSYRNNEELAKQYCGARMDTLYNIMQEDLAEQALAADGEADITSEEMKMVNLVNQARREAGTPELTLSPALCRAADIRAKEVIETQSHRRPDGSPYSNVLLDDSVGLDYRFMDGSTNAIYVAENLTIRFLNLFSPDDAYENFMNSTAHKENLLKSTHKYIGIGYYSDGKYSAWIQLFGRTQ